MQTDVDNDDADVNRHWIGNVAGLMTGSIVLADGGDVCW